PEYVANITRVYRQTLDNLRSTIGDANSSMQTGETTRQSPIGNRKYEVEMAFSRGLYTGWFGGINNQSLVHARFGKKRGVYLGTVKRIERENIVLQLEAALKPGDGIVFDTLHRPEINAA